MDSGFIQSALSKGTSAIDSIIKSSGAEDTKIKADSLPELAAKVIEIIQHNKFFERDIITGMFRSSLCGADDKNMLPPKDAEALWYMHFKERLRVKSGDRLKQLSKEDFEWLWYLVRSSCTFNSRKVMFDSIKEWDGMERIKYFMREQFNCDTNPNFFLLMLTSVIGKMVDPREYRCPFFFDFISSEKGTGKSSLFKHLVGIDRVYDAKPTSRKEDMLCNAYRKNCIFFLDDECKLLGSMFNYDEWKNFVTTDVDTFSQKYRDSEDHDRAFLVVRTSNSTRTSFDTNERRQIIFRIDLPSNGVRHWKLSDEYIEQLWAEAKHFFIENNGPYVLTDEDWGDVQKQNTQSFNTETDEFQTLVKFVNIMRTKKRYDAEYGKYFFDVHNDSHLWISYRSYNDWRKDHKETRIDARLLNAGLKAYERIYPNSIKVAPTPVREKDSSNYVVAAQIVQKQEELELPDIGL